MLERAETGADFVVSLGGEIGISFGPRGGEADVSEFLMARCSRVS